MMRQSGNHNDHHDNYQTRLHPLALLFQLTAINLFN